MGIQAPLPPALPKPPTPLRVPMIAGYFWYTYNMHMYLYRGRVCVHTLLLYYITMNYI